MSEAEKSYGEVRDVTAYTPLMHPNDAQKIVDTIAAYSGPCTRSQASDLVVELLACRGPSAKRSPSEEQDWQAYCLKLHEAFLAYPFDIGKRAVNSATGIPSKQNFFQPMHIVEFCERELAKRRATLTMAKRHLAEAERRKREADDKASGKPLPSQIRMAARPPFRPYPQLWKAFGDEFMDHQVKSGMTRELLDEACKTLVTRGHAEALKLLEGKAA